MSEPHETKHEDNASGGGEWRRLGWAAAFFLLCVAILVVARLVGVYH